METLHAFLAYSHYMGYAAIAAPFTIILFDRFPKMEDALVRGPFAKAFWATALLVSTVVGVSLTFGYATTLTTLFLAVGFVAFSTDEEPKDEDEQPDPMAEFRVLLAKVVAREAMAKARIAELEAEVKRRGVWIRRRDRKIYQLLNQVENLEEQLKPKPTDLLETNQQVMREVTQALSCFEPQDARCRAPSTHASA